MKKNNKQVLVVFLVLVVVQLVLGRSLTLDFFGGFKISSRAFDSHDYWRDIVVQLVVISYFCIVELKKIKD